MDFATARGPGNPAREAVGANTPRLLVLHDVSPPLDDFPFPRLFWGDLGVRLPSRDLRVIGSNDGKRHAGSLYVFAMLFGHRNVGSHDHG